MNEINPNYRHLLSECEPEAAAGVQGSPDYPDLKGTVLFYPVWQGTLVLAEMSGLPGPEASCTPPFFAFHIHGGSTCSGTLEMPFANAGTHYNPTDCPHPAHAGDLPPLLSCRGYAFLAVYTDRFLPQDIIGRTVIIHRNPDDFHSQPSGNPGPMIACGEIRAY